MRTLQAKASAAQVEADASVALCHLASMPGIAHQAVTLPVLRAIMLRVDGQILAAGKLWNITSRRLAPGVYRVSTKEVSL